LKETNQTEKNFRLLTRRRILSRAWHSFCQHSLNIAASITIVVKKQTFQRILHCNFASQTYTSVTLPYCTANISRNKL